MRRASTTMTVRVDAKTRGRLEKLARATARTKSFLAADAIRAYLDQNEWQTRAVEQGVAAAEAGQLLEHEPVAAWLESWGKKDESEPPE